MCACQPDTLPSLSLPILLEAAAAGHVDAGLASEARVWWARVPTVAAETAGSPRARLEGLLSDAELERAARFRFDKDRDAYVLAHALGRLLLSHATGDAPDFWRFEISSHGKPEVVTPSGQPRLRLNLSHTDGLVAASLTRSRDIGVDVEHVSRSPDIDLVARRVFSPAECAQIAAMPEPERLVTFLRFWTLKEAYVKAIGKGLAQPLQRISFTLGQAGSGPTIRLDGKAEADRRWAFAQFHPTGEHLLAVALETGGATAAIRFQEVRTGL